jgi:hypothetical protein
MLRPSPRYFTVFNVKCRLATLRECLRLPPSVNCRILRASEARVDSLRLKRS